MKKIIALILAYFLVFALTACTEKNSTDTTENVNLISADLTLDALAEVLRETGDDIDFFDIPEQYFYLILNPAIPQLCYPIDETMTFYITQTGETSYSIVLSVEISGTKTKDYTNAEEILAFIESQK